MSVVLALAYAHVALAQLDEYAVDNRAWNGLSELVELAREAAIDVRAPAVLELAQLRPRDGLLLIYPTTAPPRLPLTAFVADGGNLAIADDFGSSGSLLSALGIEREAPAAVARERRLGGNPNLLIATPERAHPLTQNVTGLVTNHPSIVRHARLEPLLGFGTDHTALVLAGGVGNGRLVALGDSSVLVNNMLAFRGNREFARNLLRFLAQSGRLWIATPNAALRGEYGVARAGALVQVRSVAARLARLELPESALQWTTLVMACVLLIGAASALPRRASYLRAVTLPAAETFAGFTGRVRLFTRKRANLTLPALSYRQGLEQRLVQQLHLPQHPNLRDVTSSLRAAGLPPAEIATTERLLVELQSLALAYDNGAPAVRLGARKFHVMVSTGERILAALGDRRAREFQHE